VNWEFFLKRGLTVVALLFAILVIGFTVLFFIVSQTPEESPREINLVNDVTLLNAIPVPEIIRPETVEQIVSLVKNHSGPISIGGSKHSMGGQTATENSLHLDMRSFNRVLALDTARREITVQTGITWRRVQEHIDPHNLSVKIMQTYSDFTVGGSLSVNVHGRYVGQGPIINSVKSLKIILANGELVNASPTNNAEIFFGCIGGYGGLGVIVEATLSLTENHKVERKSEVMDGQEYREYFITHIQQDTSIIFHNADIYPNDFKEVRAVSYVRTDKSTTKDDRLMPTGSNYKSERFAMWLVSELPGGKWIRHHWGDPFAYSFDKIVWRNYEASYNANELEPTSRKNYTYVLQEYFVPIEKFDSFVPAMADIFNRHGVNVINVSIRHAVRDAGSVLAWAPGEVFCFVVYYKQGTQPDDRRRVSIWTRELIDAAISQGGSYYLPYQIHATPEQFRAAYPRAKEFFSLKRKLDPTNKFRNKLWDAYYDLVE
jgi:FAD/FMN-containing dehydrogenase